MFDEESLNALFSLFILNLLVLPGTLQLENWDEGDIIRDSTWN